MEADLAHKHLYVVEDCCSGALVGEGLETGRELAAGGTTMLIICGTDFSERSRQALLTGAALASHLAKDAELCVVHVLGLAPDVLGIVTQGLVEKAADDRLEEEVRWLRGCSACRVRSARLSGSTVDALLDFSKTNAADLVIVASQGHGGSLLCRVGGTSERLAQSSRLPILVVREAAPFEAWARGDRSLRVLLAVDWTSSSEAAIRWVKALRKSAACDVVVGYVYYSGATGDGARRYGLEPHSLLEPDLDSERLLVRDLASRVGDLEGAGEVTFRPKHGLGRLGDHLLDLAEAERVDLIVMGTRHRHGLGRLGSVAAVTLRHGRTAVAIVPVREGEFTRPDEVPILRRVLVPTDLSAISNHAVPFGYTLLGDRGGEIYLLHVLEDDQPSGGEVDIAAQLRSLIPQRGVLGSIVTRTEVVHHRDAPRAICEAAERLGADAICMGSHGRAGLKRAILGSVAGKVMRDSRFPVFIVRPLPPS